MHLGYWHLLSHCHQLHCPLTLETTFCTVEGRLVLIISRKNAAFVPCLALCTYRSEQPEPLPSSLRPWKAYHSTTPQVTEQGCFQPDPTPGSQGQTWESKGAFTTFLMASCPRLSFLFPIVSVWSHFLCLFPYLHVRLQAHVHTRTCVSLCWCV